MTAEAYNGILYCCQVLIPCLFPFMVLAQFLNECGILDKLALIFSPLCRKILKLPGVAGGAVILSMTGGFPVGAACVSSLYDQGKLTDEQAKRMLRFAVGAGPAFVIFAVGENMLQNISTGIALYTAQILAQMTIAVANGLKSKEKAVEKKRKVNSLYSFSDSLITSCFKSSDSIIKLCAVVILFSSIVGLLSDIGVKSLIEALLCSLHISESVSQSIIFVIFEVTSGCRQAIINSAPLELVAFAIGFGGLSVHFQIFVLTQNIDYSKIDFFLHRIICGVLCAVYTYVITLFMPDTVQTISINQPQQSFFSSSTIIGSTALIVCCIVFLLSLKIKKTNFSNFSAYNNKRTKQNKQG